MEVVVILLTLCLGLLIALIASKKGEAKKKKEEALSWAEEKKKYEELLKKEKKSEEILAEAKKKGEEMLAELKKREAMLAEAEMKSEEMLAEAQKREEMLAEAKKREAKLFFEKGLPQLREAGQGSSTSSKSGTSSANAESKYPSVQVVSGVFEKRAETLTPETTSCIRTTYFQKGNAEGLTWSTEADLRAYVSSVLTDAIRASELHTCLDVLSEITITNMAALEDLIPNMLRGDVWVVSKQNYPIGVVEVKKRHTRNSLNDTSAWSSLYAQINVYMKCLRDFFGVVHVFGIVTTYEEWRVCWLHGLNAHSKAVTPTSGGHSQGAAAIKEFFERMPLSKPEVPSPITRPANTTPVSTTGTELAPATSPDHLYVSKVYEFKSADLPAVLTTTMKLMATSTISSHFLTSTLDRSFVSISNTKTVWISGAKTNLQEMQQCTLSKPPAVKCIFYLVADLRGGADGSVWLARTYNGSMHVLKFPVVQDADTYYNNDEAKKIAQKERIAARDAEYNAWKFAYPRLCAANYITKRDFAAGPALVMPLFGQVSDERGELDDEVRAIVKLDIVRLAGIGMSHDDLSWRHVGLYLDNEKKLCSVFFDLARVSYSESHTPTTPEKMLACLKFA